jgi:predicted N-formylglutamate amidohydrolase
MKNLRAHPDGFNIGDNEPYSGKHPADYTIDHHAEAAGLPHVSIEIRQDLIDDDQGVDEVAAVLHRVFDLIPERIGLRGQAQSA